VTAVSVEYEWKFDAAPSVLTAIDQAFSGDRQILKMETVYYDTPSGALSARHYTLRKRMENGVPVCTLKTPSGAARSEWEIPCETIEEAILKFPALGCPADFSSIVEEGLRPVCGAKFTRIAKTVSLPEGTVEIALDEGILMGGSREVPLCEVEVELKSGSKDACDAFAKILATKFHLQVQPASKFRRALALYKGESYA
jgi:inorganic triphosphatase YgiF